MPRQAGSFTSKAFPKVQTLNVYFAGPYASRQRGCNENTNGLLRQFFPKGNDFRNVTDKDVAKAVRILNNRPRKVLNYQTPNEVLLLPRVVRLHVEFRT